MKKRILDPEEKRLLESYERGEWKPIRNQEEEMAKLRQYARNTLKKNKRINIRLSERDLLGIQAKAIEEGLPYQTLIIGIYLMQNLLHFIVPSGSGQAAVSMPILAPLGDLVGITRQTNVFIPTHG